jgi:catechol 2,3-dioxygenase-like lactoylglutathione lyase family enzyme
VRRPQRGLNVRPSGSTGTAVDSRASRCHHPLREPAALAIRAARLGRPDFSRGCSMIIDHIGLAVSDYEQSKVFFTQALTPLGIGLVLEVEGWAGFGRNGKPEFWFGTHSQKQNPMHIAFLAENRAQVRAFHAAALRAGGTDNGAPGIRTLYHPDYYGAFVIGPDGHNVEAVCHRPEG